MARVWWRMVDETGVRCLSDMGVRMILMNIYIFRDRQVYFMFHVDEVCSHVFTSLPDHFRQRRRLPLVSSILVYISSLISRSKI